VTNVGGWVWLVLVGVLVGERGWCWWVGVTNVGGWVWLVLVGVGVLVGERGGWV
jgi:hypothetical protein